MAENEKLRQWLLDTARMMVDHPDAVKVEPIGTGANPEFRLRVDPSDIGKMIGKQGRTSRALRMIGMAIAMASGKRFALDIADEEKRPI